MAGFCDEVGRRRKKQDVWEKGYRRQETGDKIGDMRQEIGDRRRERGDSRQEPETGIFKRLNGAMDVHCY